MRRIEIDDEVYDALAGRVVGFQQPNDVLRTVLRLEQDRHAASATTPSRPGRLAPLLAAGLLAAGDKLVHVQTRKGVCSRGQVDADGWIVTENGRYAQPSPALRDLVGSQIDGWANWTHERSSKSLRRLREEMGGTPSG